MQHMHLLLEWILDSYTAYSRTNSYNLSKAENMYMHVPTRRVGRTRLWTLISVSRRALESLVLVLQLDICTTQRKNPAV